MLNTNQISQSLKDASTKVMLGEDSLPGNKISGIIDDIVETMERIDGLITRTADYRHPALLRQASITRDSVRRLDDELEAANAND